MKHFFTISRFFLILSVLAVALVSVATLFPFIVVKYVWFRTSVDAAFIFFLLGLLFSPQARVYEARALKLAKNPLAIAVTSFVLFFVLASLFAFDSGMAFWSNFERGEGGLQLLHLWLFFSLLTILFQEEKSWQKIFRWSLVTGLLMAFYGFLTGIGTSGFIGPLFFDPSFRFQGSIGNPAYVAAYVIFMLFYIFYLLASNKKKGFSLERIVLSVMILIFLAVFFAAATRGAFLGLVAAILGFLGYFIYLHRAWRKWLLSSIVFLVLVVALLIGFQKTSFVKAIPGSRIFDINFAAQTFETRTVMWQIAWSGFKARPLLGWGPENFLQVFDRKFNPAYFDPNTVFGAWFDRAHSVYFDYLAETGIFGFLSFLSIFILFYRAMFKKVKIDTNALPSGANDQSKAAANQPVRHSSLIYALMFALPIAYLVQGIVLFDVLPIYLNMFLFLAFAIYKFDALKTPQNLKSQ